MELGALQGRQCPACGVAGAIVTYRLRPNGTESAICSAGCDTAKLTAAVIRLNGSLNGASNAGAKDEPLDTLLKWRNRIEILATSLYRADPEYQKGHLTWELIAEPVARDMEIALGRMPEYFAPASLSKSEANEEAQAAAQRSWEKFRLTERPDLIVANGYHPSTVQESSLIICEDYEDARTANELYLQRRAIVDQLFYSESISLAVGGKHHGKTTLTRTGGMCIMRGLDFLGRHTEQGHVIYAASDDEVASTRMELLRMGWNAKTDPLSLVRIDPEAAAEPERVLEQIGKLAVRLGAIFIILDMLFDFTGIKDEMGYAHTRQAIGKVQTLADLTKAHVLSTHHSPKYMTDLATAATAALGSQGIAARFSPILLTRRWADDLFSVESTMTRDPRGKAIPPTCVVRTPEGWLRPDGEFKDWMKWKIYAPRIMGMIDGGEPGKEYTVASVAQEFDIPRPQAQNALYQLWKSGDLQRDKKGRGFRYWKMLEKPVESSQTEMDIRDANSHWRGGND